jgi:hypothetical protein
MFQQKPPAPDSGREPEDGKFEMKMEIDQRAAEDTGLEKRLTLFEYKHEFSRQAQAEAQVFDRSLTLLGQLMADPKNAPVIGDFILTILKETETPFVHTQSGKPSIVADSLKAIHDERVRQVANSF